MHDVTNIARCVAHMSSLGVVFAVTDVKLSCTYGNRCKHGGGCAKSHYWIHTPDNWKQMKQMKQLKRVSETVASRPSMAVDSKALPVPPSPAKQSDSNLNWDCVVCTDKPSTHIVVPCMHLCLCEDHAKGFEECPICRTKVNSVQRVFRP